MADSGDGMIGGPDAPEFQFLDLEGINDDDRKLLDDILFDGKVKKEKKIETKPDNVAPPKTSNPDISHSSQEPVASEPSQAAGNDPNYQYAAGANPVVYINNVTANVNLHHPCPPPTKDEPVAPNQAQMGGQVNNPPNHAPIHPNPLQRPPPPAQFHLGSGFPPPPVPPQAVSGYFSGYANPGMAQPMMTQPGKNVNYYPSVSFYHPSGPYVQLTIPPYMTPMTNPAVPPSTVGGPMSPGQQPRPPPNLTLMRPPVHVSQHNLMAALIQQQQQQLIQQQLLQQGQTHPVSLTQPLPQQQPTQPPPMVQRSIEQKPEMKKEDHVVVNMEDVEEKAAEPEKIDEPEIIEETVLEPEEIEEPEEEEVDEESDGEGIAFGTVDATTLNTAVAFEDLTVKVADEEKKEEVKEEANQSESWASLFFKKEQPSSDGPKGEQKPTALIPPNNAIPEVTNQEEQVSKVSQKDLALAEVLKTYKLGRKASAIKPRGLSNRSNWCFVNAILQALVACPPFFNLMKNLPKDLLEKPEPGDTKSCDMNILRSVHSFFAEFSPLDHFPKLRRDKKAKNEEVPQGKTLEPSTVYNVLLNLTSDTFKVIEGRQEDAEEFLTFLLNGLNDEMMALFKMVEPDPEERDEEEGDAEDWQEVGPRNKSCVTRRGGGLAAQHDLRSLKPPIADIFQGQMRSSVQISNGEPTATLQPFFTLQLDIQSSNVKNLTDALNSNFTMENLDGYLCSKTKQEIAASRSMSFEELPPILVLHLKRFVFGANGCQKLLKNIDFPVDLEIGRDILSPNSKSKYAVKQRQYKLFAVVYHNGTEATKGHYVADIYHTGLSTWIRCDDSVLKAMTESMVMAHSASSVPYILFYRRGDTMVGNSQQPTSAASSAK